MPEIFSRREWFKVKAGKALSFFLAAAVFLSAAVYVSFTAHSLLPYLTRPRLIYYYITSAPMRRLMNLIAEEKLRAFPTVWDISHGVLLSKKIYQPLEMEGRRSYVHRSNLKKLYFETGIEGFQRRFSAPDSAELRRILKKLKTPFLAEASFDTYGFRRTGYDFQPDCKETLLFAGDSFTEGIWVRDEDTFAGIYAKAVNERSDSNTCVINSGTNGYGIQEESFIARTYFEKFRYRTIYLMPYPNDVAEDVLSMLSGSVPDIDKKWRIYFNELSKLLKFAQANRVKIVLIPIPPKEQFAMPETRKNYQEKLAEFCRTNGIEFWDPFETLSRYTWEDIYLDWDPHFNASGHKILAGFLREKALTSQSTGL